MGKRNEKQQSAHDEAVKKSAEYYEEQGYAVQADIKGFKKPKTIKERRPDLIAKKKKETVILEVETKETMETDKKQREMFKKYADSHKNVRFRTKMVAKGK